MVFSLRYQVRPRNSGNFWNFITSIVFHLLRFRKKIGVPSATLQIWIRTFEHETPELSDLMKKRGKEITPDDYKSLQSEIARLKKELADERLRADFYEEMVAFGKEVYGIDLKKIGTK